MNIGQDDLLFGRIALHYKLLTREQLLAATQKQAREGGYRKLGEILVETGALTAPQLEQLLAVQRDYVAKQAQQEQAASSPSPDLLAGSPLPASLVEEPAPAPSLVAAVSAAAMAAPEPPAAPALPRHRPSSRSTKRPESSTASSKPPCAGGASDIHVHSGSNLKVRLHGRLQELDGGAPVPATAAERVILEILTEEQREELRVHGQVDFAYTLPGVGRFRGNVYRQQRGMRRRVPRHPARAADARGPRAAHLARALRQLPPGDGAVHRPGRLRQVLDAGRAGQHHQRGPARTTSSPSKTRSSTSTPRSSAWSTSARSGATPAPSPRALRAALREDPDIIAIGELRDLETISLALTAAETGHLVLGTLHTNNAIRTINRILGVFPPSQQEQIRTMVSESLRAVVSQRLVTGPTATAGCRRWRSCWSTRRSAT